MNLTSIEDKIKYTDLVEFFESDKYDILSYHYLGGGIYRTVIELTLSDWKRLEADLEIYCKDNKIFSTVGVTKKYMNDENYYLELTLEYNFNFPEFIGKNIFKKMKTIYK